ncbi:MAG: hypothetical protein NC394_00260 [Bacteroides sp.]|nr:hypothetical protein [Bacteroides sp.]
MRSEDLFEILSDIDEDMICNAKENNEDFCAEPLQITSVKKGFPWKTVCASAAVISAVVFAGALTFGGTDIVLPPHERIADPIKLPYSASFPEEAKYVYKGDFSELELMGPPDTDRLSYSLYDKLERHSDLVVCGAFTDDARQTNDPSKERDFASSQQVPISYNKFKIEKLIKGNGDVNEGDEIIISDFYAVYGNTLYSQSNLTPMIKGDVWFYFLKKTDEANVYRALCDSDGRYALPERSEQMFPLSGNNIGCYDLSVYKENVHQIIYDRFYNNSFEPDIQNIVNSDDCFKIDTYSFELAEFSGVHFIWSSEEVEAVLGEERYTLYWGMPVWDIWLADINGDGKREICSSVSVGSGIICEDVMVCDYENGDTYRLCDRGKYDYTIYGAENGILYFAKTEYGDYSREKTVYEPLSLTLMNKESSEETTFENGQPELNQAADVKEDDDGSGVSFKIYEPFGMTYESEKKGLYYNGKKVRWFEDYYPADEDGNLAGTDYICESGVVDVYAVRDFSEPVYNPDGSLDPSGRLVGLKEFSEEEFAQRDIKATLTDKEVTHIAYAEDDSTAVETDNELAFPVSEATDSIALSDGDMIEAQEELLQCAEEYKPFGVTYDQKENIMKAYRYY